MTQPPQARHNADLRLSLDTGPPPDLSEHKPLAPRAAQEQQQQQQQEQQKQHTRSPFARGRYGPGKKDPWIQLKWALFVVFGLAVWSFYIVVGRVCTPMIRGTSSSGLGRSVGAGALVGFVILWLLFVWSYLKVITAPPGFAVDVSSPGVDLLADIRSTSPSLCPHYSPRTPSPPQETVDRGPDPPMLAPAFDLVNDAVEQAYPDSSHVPAGTHREGTFGNGGRVRDWREVQRPVPSVESGPRWCQFCEINKPDRTHHCRHCGTCVLQFDHHCLWVGQCVGWANHKFFMIFNFWTLLYCLYIMIFLIVAQVKSNKSDGQVIALIAVTAVFGLFAGVMGASHTELILSSRTTVETFRGREQHERENDVLQREYGYFWHNMEKRKVRKHWKEQWGGSTVDSRWAVGTKRQRWEQEMGKPILGWILPIGRPQGDGIHFDTNPRFGPKGEWLMKQDWPQGVV